ncbi:glycine cleavage system aminomethyltransferase GcvT [bacterium]|nr:glycine cleavage system aminomethyltransferase GcvT [candidate division CSSED10-310 bacterium]
MSNLKHTGLYEAHIRAGGKIVPFAGYELPVQYESIKVEHEAVRTTAGMFDVSHMGEIYFSGPDALENVQKLVTQNIEKIKPNRAVYSGMLYTNGTFVDDVLVYRISEDEFMLVVNAANLAKDYAWMKENLFGDCKCENRSDAITQIAIQGPKSKNIVQQLTNLNLDDLKYYRFRQHQIIGIDAIVSRTGYTGEHGYELYFNRTSSIKVWDALLEAGQSFGLKPAGLGCRDTLRLEAGMPLYGNDIDDQHTPLEAGLDWTVKMEKEDFNGKNALLQQQQKGLGRHLVGFELIDKGVPRHGYPIFSGSKNIGIVTSGTMSITLGKPIGMAYIRHGFEQLGTEFDVEIRNKHFRAKVIPMPFYSVTRTG